jgi:hypothetical protein
MEFEVKLVDSCSTACHSPPLKPRNGLRTFVAKASPLCRDLDGAANHMAMSQEIGVAGLPPAKL